MLVILCAGLVVFARRVKVRFEETGERLPIGWISLRGPVAAIFFI